MSYLPTQRPFPVLVPLDLLAEYPSFNPFA